jgi:hypothetical protein
MAGRAAAAHMRSFRSFLALLLALLLVALPLIGLGGSTGETGFLSLEVLGEKNLNQVQKERRPKGIHLRMFISTQCGR